MHRFQFIVRHRRSPEALHCFTGIVGAPPAGNSHPENDFLLLPVCESKCHLYGAAGIQAGPDFA